METKEESGKEATHEVLEAELRYSVQKSAATARQQAANDLRRHLVKSINNAECGGEVVFICKDGERVHALKMLCMRRSEMLTAMFKNGMFESNSPTVTLPEIHSRTLLSILEYFYSGDISSRYQPTDWKMGLEIIAAARYFMLPSCVQHIVEGHLLEQINDAEKDPREAAVMLSMAVEYKASHLTLVGGLTHLLRRAWMHGDCGSQLSEEALDLLLRRTKNADVTDTNRIKPSLNEFFRFRGVLRWAIFHSGLMPSDDAQSHFDRIIPGTKAKLCRVQCPETSITELEWLPGYERDSANNEISDMLQAHQLCKEAAVRLLANINWVQIPPQLFTRIVEPLKLVSDYQLMSLFRFYYITRHLSVHLSWIHGSQLVQSRRGFCIQSRQVSSRYEALAVCELPSCPDETVHIWTFKVEKFVAVLNLGFVFWRSRAEIKSWDFNTCFLSEGKNRKSARALEFVIDGRGLHFWSIWEPNQVWSYPSLSPAVQFRYDRRAHQCSVKVGSLDLGPVFKDLPCQNFFPAISMHDPAKVTIAVHSGFDTV